MVEELDPNIPRLPPNVERAKGGYLIEGRFVRDYKNSRRPPWIWPEIWKMMHVAARDKEAAEWEILRGRLEAAEAVAPEAPLERPASSPSSSSRPAALCTENSVPDELRGGSLSFDSEENDNVAMPTMPCANVHRDHVVEHELPFSALVARPVNKAEVRVTPAAQVALQKEWDKLRAAGCWDESGVREWADVAAEARKKNTKAHVGMIFDICVEKGSELPKGDPGGKVKGRVVFQGNNVQDESWNTALFQELRSSPATVEAGKACDAFGLAPGHAVQQADAEQARRRHTYLGEAPGRAAPRPLEKVS